MRQLFFGSRVILGILFLASGISKASNLDAFEQTINTFGYTSQTVSQILAYVIPTLEIISASLVLLGVLIQAGLIVLIFLLLTFVAAIVPIISIGTEMECGCFGPLFESNIGYGLLIRDLVLIVLAFTLLSYHKKHMRSDT